MKRRPLIKEAKARSLEPRGLMLLERGSVVSRDIAFFLHFFSFCFSSLFSGDEKAISLLLGGSTQPMAGFSVAHVDEGKRRPL